ncbi:MAG: copper oxidase [Gemmatimonadota bacterium]|nr:copper oxidase [Gemmatimonadota bacterium]
MHSRYSMIFLMALALAAVGSASTTATRAEEHYGPDGQRLPYTPVVTPNGSTLPWRMVDGVKEFHLVAEEIDWEFAPGMVVKCWGYNGQTPGPTIETVEGDQVRIYVTNRLPEPTAVHWHGILLPSGMDGVQGLSQNGIPPGETYVYEFTLRQHGTQMYHSHGDEMTQIGLGTMGFFIIHPRQPTHRIDRDFAIFLNEWAISPGTARPNPNVMTNFDIFTFNSRVFPGTELLVARTGDRVRIRIANVAQESHPIHLHGHNFQVVATDGGDVPIAARWPETTVLVAPGQTRDFEFTANPGDWAMHCHRRHHPMNAMGHDIPNVIGVQQAQLEEKIRELLPGYMAMGESGMHEHALHAAHHEGPDNTLPMMGGDGPFGTVAMGGMFTVLKVRDRLESYDVDPGWYDNPAGTVAGPAELPAYWQSQSSADRAPSPARNPQMGSTHDHQP